MTGPTGERIAVVGAGVGGLTAAYVLSRAHRVTLWEAQPRLGGHAHTHELDGASGPLRVDTGFIVHNDRTYPLLRRLFGELGIRAHPTEMSMSVRDERSGLEYAGGRGLSGFLARPRQLARGDYRRMLLAVRRFHRLARDFLTTTDDSEQTSFGDFCAAARFGPDFVRLYAVPVVACVWSTGSAEALDYPARHLFRFLDHHGMLELGNSPQWFTVAGGSHRYVEAVASRIAEVRVGRPVTAVRRLPDGVEVSDGTGDPERFDRVVVATHPDEALRLLADPTDLEREVLGSFRYSTNETVLHRYPGLLPRARSARASWNYLVRAEGDGPAVVTYWMNRLQGLPETDPLFVTLNATERIPATDVIATMRYAHPVYDARSVQAQRRLPELSVGRTAYAGAYHGWGFHEDGARAGVAAAASFGVSW